MKTVSEFSVKSIKDNFSSVPETYSGEKCNISLNAVEVMKQFSDSGGMMCFHSLGLALCIKGRISSNINYSRRELTGGILEIVGFGTMEDGFEASEDAEVVGMAFSLDYLESILHSSPDSFFNFGMIHNIALSETETEMTRDLIISYYRATVQYGEESAVSKGIAYSILQLVISKLKESGMIVNRNDSRMDVICQSFANELARTKGKMRSVSYFAEQLCVSPHYLSVAVKRSSGQSAKDLIDKAAVSELKMMLHYSSMSISEIAEQMDFPSSSFLCKFFKKQTGVSPMQYRKMHKF